MNSELPRRRSSLSRRTIISCLALAAGYFAVTYLFVPFLWGRYTARHPALEDIPRIAYAADGIPGDPLNVALIATERELKKIMVAAHWYPADPLSFKSCLEIAEATVLSRPYDEAPVSSLYFEGRKEDLAFEKPVGDNPRKRHHVRFWKTKEIDGDNQPVWVGSVTFDESVGLSHTTGQFTHHIDPDVDAERDGLFADLEKTGDLAERYVIDDFHKVREGKNGEGDVWRTDGKLCGGIVKPEAKP